MNNGSKEDFSFGDLECFLREQESLLQRDRVNLQKGNTLQNKRTSPAQSLDEGNSQIVQPKEKRSVSSIIHSKMVKDEPARSFPLSPREKDKERLINEISKPQSRQLCKTNAKVLNNRNTRVKNINFSADIREKEKDRLASIFASSSSPYSKPTNYQISKNLNSDFGFRDKEFEEDKILKSTNAQQTFDSDNLNCIKVSVSSDVHNVPEILISQYSEDFKNQSVEKKSGLEEKSMVRIGEYSPHNPKLPSSRPMLGVGEYDERRILLQDQRRQEYNQYLLQAQGMPRRFSFSQDSSGNSHQLKDVATQTDWDDDEHSSTLEIQRYQQPCSKAVQVEQRQKCASSTCRLSPVPGCFEGLSEKEIKEHLYREELRKQIEEKCRLKEEMRRREEEEEAKIEEKIQKDLEKMKRQYEEERLQRLEIAIRKKEQEDLHRQRLAAEQRKSVHESKSKKKQVMVNKSTSPREVPARRPVGSKFVERQTVAPLNQCLPVSKVLNNVHDELRKPLLEIEERQMSSKVLSKNASVLNHTSLPIPLASSPPIPSLRTKDVDILVNRTVFDPKAPRSSKQIPSEPPLQSASENVRDKLKDVDMLLRQPLLPESFQTLPPVSPPLLHATIPPPTSVSPPVPASKRIQRTNSEILEDRWKVGKKIKVPYVEQYNAAAPDVFTRHNRSVLTQLGSFRKHLQEERRRMQDRVKDESP